MEDIRAVVSEILGGAPNEITYLDSGNNDVVRVQAADTGYVLKRFETDRYRAYEREIGMRECLRYDGRIAFPDILASVERGGTRYALMEDMAGERLQEIWNRNPTRVAEEMSTLGRVLGFLHEIPVEGARRFLEREDVLFSEEYFGWMMETIAPYSEPTGQGRLLRRCYEVVRGTPVEEVVIHGDFGPHQVIVDSQGQWVLVDFEYAALGAFADDLGGAEVRLERQDYANIEGFLAGYESVRGTLGEYESVRAAYKAYNLLAMLTYRLAYRGEEPPAEAMDRLASLLASL